MLTANLDNGVTAAEILAFMAASGNTGWGLGTEEMWTKCIEQSLCVVTVRQDDGVIVGLGFLVGNARHAEPVDVSVLPELQRQGLGKQIMDKLMSFAIESNIRFVNLIADPGKPWLKDYYGSMGFHPIDFAMTHERSFAPEA